MARPQVIVNTGLNNLGIIGDGGFGTPALVMAIPSAPTAGFGVPFSIKSKKDADAAFAAVGNAAVLTAIKDGFYAEAPEGLELFIVCVVNTNSLAQIATAAVADSVLNFAGGKARLVAFVKFPDLSYVPVPAGGFDADVHTGATAAQALADAWLVRNKPFRALIQGYGFTNIAATQSYAVAALRNVAIIVGAVNDSTQIFTLLVLGRACVEQPQRSIGRVKSGSLKIPNTSTVKIGSTLVDNVALTDLDTLDTKRYIFPVKNEIASGYVINRDCMLVTETDDFNNLRHGRIIDNAVRIAYESYYEELKDDVFVDANGRLAPVVEKALESKIESDIDAQMRGQMNIIDNKSMIKALVNPDPLEYPQLYAQNNISNPNLNILTNGGKIYVFLNIQPKGALEKITVFIGLTATV